MFLKLPANGFFWGTLTLWSFYGDIKNILLLILNMFVYSLSHPNDKAQVWCLGHSDPFIQVIVQITGHFMNHLRHYSVNFTRRSGPVSTKECHRDTSAYVNPHTQTVHTQLMAQAAPQHAYQQLKKLQRYISHFCFTLYHHLQSPYSSSLSPFSHIIVYAVPNIRPNTHMHILPISLLLLSLSRSE